MDLFWHFQSILSIQNVNVSCFARNGECDFLGDFQTLWDEKIPFQPTPTNGI